MKPDETTPAFIGNPIREADERLCAPSVPAPSVGEPTTAQIERAIELVDKWRADRRLLDQRFITSSDCRILAKWIAELLAAATQPSGEYERGLEDAAVFIEKHYGYGIAASEIRRIFIRAVTQPATGARCVLCGHSDGVDNAGICVYFSRWEGMESGEWPCGCKCEFPTGEEDSGEGPTGCMDDGDELSQALRGVSQQALTKKLDKHLRGTKEEK